MRQKQKQLFQMVEITDEIDQSSIVPCAYLVITHDVWQGKQWTSGMFSRI